MKYIISETQYNFIFEQNSDAAFDRRYGNYDAAEKYSAEMQKIYQPFRDWYQENKHIINPIAQLAASFFGPIGKGVSVAIGVVDAIQYFQDGDPKTGAFVLVFAGIPAVGGLASKLGLSAWSSKLLGEIGKKIHLGAKLNSTELAVANVVAKNRQLIQTELSKLGKDATIATAKKGVKKQLVKQGIKKSAINTAKQWGGYGLASVGYNQTYDYFKGRLDNENFVKYVFGHSGSPEDEKKYKAALSSGWNPSKPIPPQFQTDLYKQGEKLETL
jgi:hypothetical protein